jgi:hypothetical protein
MQVSDLIDIIKQYLKLSSDIEFAKTLGVAPVTVASWKKRNSIGTMMEHIIKNKIPISFDKLLHQEGNHNIGINVQQNECCDAELQKLLQAALALGTSEDIKSLIREYIKRCAI